MADQSQEQKLAPTTAPSTSTSQKPARKPVIKTVKQTSTKTAVTPTKQRTLRQKKKDVGQQDLHALRHEAQGDASPTETEARGGPDL
ncbi:unnamed protein product [Danaus chrysippus]|uniref:(African queen) hypothetical protein n=1 Tax=Danaus chrysippus TaxID=151541 RepID=A0A8J2W6N3_9NEOP|nr:unnamed protein product [Danaus chrysippus]